MSPVLSREERDAIRAKATGATKGDDPSYYAGTFVADVFTLLDALDALVEGVVAVAEVMEANPPVPTLADHARALRALAG